MLAQNQENLKMIKQLNIKNKSLQKLLNEAKKQGDYYKSQVFKLSSRSKDSYDLDFIKKTRSKSKIFDLQAKKSNRASTPLLKSYEHSTIPSISSVDEDEMSNAIKNTENEVKKLSEKYQKLQNVQLESSEIELFRRNLEDICVSMEKKNKELYQLKKRHQECLKLKLNR